MNNRENGNLLVEFLAFFLIMTWVLWAGIWMSRASLIRLALLDAADTAAGLGSLREISHERAAMEAEIILERSGVPRNAAAVNMERFRETSASRFYRLLAGNVFVEIPSGPWGGESVMISERAIVQEEAE